MTEKRRTEPRCIWQSNTKAESQSRLRNVRYSKAHEVNTWYKIVKDTIISKWIFPANMNIITENRRTAEAQALKRSLQVDPMLLLPITGEINWYFSNFLVRFCHLIDWSYCYSCYTVLGSTDIWKYQMQFDMQLSASLVLVVYCH